MPVDPQARPRSHRRRHVVETGQEYVGKHLCRIARELELCLRASESPLARRPLRDAETHRPCTEHEGSLAAEACPGCGRRYYAIGPACGERRDRAWLVASLWQGACGQIGRCTTEQVTARAPNLPALRGAGIRQKRGADSCIERRPIGAAVAVHRLLVRAMADAATSRARPK